MRKQLFLAMLIILSSLTRLWAFDLRFSNDGCSWGFIPEWDDYETYSLKLSQEWELQKDISRPFETEINYHCYTLRGNTAEESLRIDAVAFTTKSSLTKVLDDAKFLFNFGVSTEYFDNLQGLSIQTGWHGNVNVAREVPETYDPGFFSFTIPLSFNASSSHIKGAELTLKTTVGLPVKLEAAVDISYRFPDYFRPLSVSGGWKTGYYKNASASYSASKMKQSGFQISSKIICWPIQIYRTQYMSTRWGTGSFGFRIAEPSTSEDNSTIVQLVLSGLNCQLYGYKIEKIIISDLFVKNLDFSVCLTSLNGWMPDKFIFPDGGRSSALLAGVSPFYKWQSGPVRFDFSIPINTGLKQNNYYILEMSEARPKHSINNITVEAGAGIRLLLPFLYNRIVGLSFEAIREWYLCSFPNDLTKDLSEPFPYRFSLGIAVTGAD